MTELSGFSAAQSLTQIGPQSLRLPTSLAEVCECECDCAASRILRGLAQIVGSRITNLIEIDVQAVDTPDRVQVTVIPWDRYGVDKKGAAPPGGWIAVDGSEVVGMGNDEYAGRWSCNMPLEWDGQVTAELDDEGRAVLHFQQPTSANRPFVYTVKNGQGEEVVQRPSYINTDGAVTLRLIDGPGTYTVHVATQYPGVAGESEPVIVAEPESTPEPVTVEPDPAPEPESTITRGGLGNPTPEPEVPPESEPDPQL